MVSLPNGLEKERCLPHPLNHAVKAYKRLIATSGIIIVFMAVLWGGYAVAAKIISDPNIVFLFSSKGAEWIRLEEPFILSARDPEERVHIFRVRFTVDNVPDKSILSFQAMKRAVVFIDGRLLYLTDNNLNNWKKIYHLNLAPELQPGSHELYIKVLNKNGHPALLAYSRELQIYTGAQWEVSNDGSRWTPAVTVRNLSPPSISRLFERADRVFLSKLWFYAPIFLVIFSWSFLYTKQKQDGWMHPFMPTPAMVRWAILLLWCVLAANNIGKIPLDVGMDVMSHMAYVRKMAETWRVPLADEGLQMFQAPLFYTLAAAVYNVSTYFFTQEVAARILRMIPLFCGAAQVELSFRMMRCAYPQRKDLQILGTVVGGLLPMNLYISQVVGNEPLAGLFSGIVIVLCFRVFLEPASQKRENFLLIGLFLGLAVLTKITAILLAPSIVFFIAATDCWKNKPVYKIIILKIKRISFVVGIALLVAGWYYLYNYIELGRFFIGGWEAGRGFVWWQDPGYRTLKQFFSFGEALFYPIYAGAGGIWDSLYSTLWLDGFLSHLALFNYRPPWNYDVMLSMAWLSILPAAAIIMGIVKTLTAPPGKLRISLLFVVSCIFVYMGAILYLYLSVPIYSAGKATYMLGLLPALTVLCAEGLDVLMRWSILRAAVYGIIGCWAGTSYLAYFVWQH